MTTSYDQKHPLEAKQSWNLFMEREQKQNEQQNRRNLKKKTKQRKKKKKHSTTDDDDEVTSFRRPQYNDDIEVIHKEHNHKIPIADGTSMHGMMIDAGSQGTRIHIYEFDIRLLLDREEILGAANGQMLSFPTTNTRWTDKYTPGLDVFGQYQGDDLKFHVANYLRPLVGFAKQVLKEKQDDWSKFPIYLKATGGLRTLPTPDRVRLMNCVRELFHNTTFNPFDFEDERARVISGEEEGAYGWVAVNFIKGKLVEESVGTGTVLNPRKLLQKCQESNKTSNNFRD
jgi:hypothetical protein